MRRAERGVLVALALVAGAAHAGEGRRMLGDAEAQSWRGVGRLNIEDRRFCTATLVAPDVVLTAAHCIFHPGSGRQFHPATMRFVAGPRLGSYAAVRRVKAAVAHPAYGIHLRGTIEAVAADLALVALDEPVADADAAAFAIGAFGNFSDGVTVVSYARDRAHAPSIERDCSVTEADWPVVAVDCEVNYGASGAPVFAIGADTPVVVAVVSAFAENAASRFALTVAVAPMIDALRAALVAVRSP